MPIYAYRCSACGRAKDVLQKMSDPVLTDCPFCGAPAFVKQVTAAGFQLKGSGWYVTDFRGDSKAPKLADGEKDAPKPGSGGDAAPPTAEASPVPAPAPAASPAPAAAVNPPSPSAGK